MQLSLRLSAIARMVTQGNRLADVGCDHGYLPVYLILNQKIPSAIAMDVRPGPLERAKEHIRQYGLEEYIQTRLSDGLGAMDAGEADTIVIAGMGGPLMERILLEGASIRDTAKEMILQPQSDIPHFRHFIREQGWEIVEEELVWEDGKFYPMMKVLPENKSDMEVYTRQEEAFGKLLLRDRHPVLKDYLLREERIRRDILDRLDASQGQASRTRQKEIKEELQLIKAALDRYESI